MSSAEDYLVVFLFLPFLHLQTPLRPATLVDLTWINTCPGMETCQAEAVFGVVLQLPTLSTVQGYCTASMR